MNKACIQEYKAASDRYQRRKAVEGWKRRRYIRSIDSPIYIQLQRKYTENGTEHSFETVEINGQSYIQIQKGYEGWNYEFTGLEKYQDDECTIPYTYRVVEGTIGDDGEFQAVDEGGSL